MNDEQNFFNSYLTEKDNKMDKDIEKKMAVLEDIFSSSNTEDNESFSLEDNLPFKNTGSYPKMSSSISSNYNNDILHTSNNDPLERTLDISSVEPSSQLEYLYEVKNKLMEEENNHSNQDSGQTKGAQKVLSSNPKIKYYDDNLNDSGQILNSFISCVQLAGITALMGACWLVYLVIHLM